MLKDLAAVSKWYVLNENYKVYESCPSCKSSDIKYFKVRSQLCKGIAPECGSCGKDLPVRLKLISKIKSKKCVSY